MTSKIIKVYSDEEKTEPIGTYVADEHYAEVTWPSRWEVVGDYVEPAAQHKIISKLDYMHLFSDAELEAIYSAAKSSIAVEVWLEKFRLATDINLDDPRTIAGVQALEAAGLLAAGRAAEILA